MLKDHELFGVRDKVAEAITVLKDLEPVEGYYLAFSGGKDSITIKQLAIDAEVKFDAHYSLTTIDPPEIVRFIRKEHPDVIFNFPDKPFLQRLPENGFPQRQRRWCCAEYKENGGAGRIVITGIRAQESKKRAGRKMIESCYKSGNKRYLNLIVGWTEEDVWEFIQLRRLPYPILYDQGWKRVGCLFCPMASNSHRQIERKLYPRHEALFIKAFERLYAGKDWKKMRTRWGSGREMFEWWINEKSEGDPDQGVLFE